MVNDTINETEIKEIQKALNFIFSYAQSRDMQITNGEDADILIDKMFNETEGVKKEAFEILLRDEEFPRETLPRVANKNFTLSDGKKVYKGDVLALDAIDDEIRKRTSSLKDFIIDICGKPFIDTIDNYLSSLQEVGGESLNSDQEAVTRATTPTNINGEQTQTGVSTTNESYQDLGGESPNAPSRPRAKALPQVDHPPRRLPPGDIFARGYDRSGTSKNGR